MDRPIGINTGLILGPIMILLLSRHCYQHIEDYMTKATSTSPTQAYLSLPQVTFSSTENKTITLDDLTWPEKYRLFRAFLKFEVMTKIYDPRLKHSMDKDYYRENAQDLLKGLDSGVHETVLCVYAYVEASYGSIFAQLRRTCDSTSGSANTARIKQLLFPDNLFFSADVQFSDIYLPRDCPPLSRWLSCHGLDLLSHVLTQTRQTLQSREHLRSWLYSVSIDFFGPSQSFYGFDYEDVFAHQAFRLSQLFTQNLFPHTDISLACHLHHIDNMQDTLFGPPMLFEIYRQREWIFCDNWRL
ncbi:hypothetical protein FCULG_00007484 [Fusarium culmorum]|uniref:Uncharacterized protein n=1 Tax=Fusarium culmorum TaxID=5516 RepID=A0A2T4H310_FUSCU|nr:hypothetical protein FCULG_00007484 [Fusarium culmorum]